MYACTCNTAHTALLTAGLTENHWPPQETTEELNIKLNLNFNSSSLSAFSIYYNPWHPPYSIHVLYSLFPQSLSKFSLVYLLAWYPPPHTPYISSPNHCLLFATHAHIIGTCFAVVLRLCHLILVSLSTLYLELYLVASRHRSIYCWQYFMYTFTKLH